MHQAPQHRPRHAEPGSPANAGLADGVRLRGYAYSRGLLVPEPQFSRKHPGGGWWDAPAPRPVPETQPEPNPQIDHQDPGVDQSGEDQPGEDQPGVEQLRWARCPDDGRLHLVQPTDVTLAAVRGYAPAVCGHRIAAEGLTINNVPLGAMCMACVIVATS